MRAKKYFSFLFVFLFVLSTVVIPVNFLTVKAANTSLNGITLQGSDGDEESGYLNSTFEDGTLQNWDGRGATATNVTSDSHNGSHCLKISGRVNTSQGPSLDITNKVQPGAIYHFSAWVMYKDGPNTKQVNLQIQYTNTSNTTSYPSISNVTLNKGQWGKVEGNYTIPTDAKSVYVYMETPYKQSGFTSDDTMDLYVDDVMMISPGVIAHSDFEDGTVDNMEPRGCTLSVSHDVYHGGANSLKVSGRTAEWNGPSYNMINLMETGKSYSVSGWVYQNSGSDQKISLTMDILESGKSEDYKTIAYQQTIPDKTWTQIKGDYTLNNTGILSKLSMYFESPNPTLEFYLDDFSVIDKSGTPSVETDIPSLCEQYKDYFKVGVGITADDIVPGTLSAQITAKHFNSITAGNEMKIDATEPNENQFDFTRGDKFTEFAQANNMVVRGHCLVWHSQVPDWMFLKDPNGPKYDSSNFCDKATLLSRMRNHIDKVMGHYKDLKLPDGRKLVYAWDVVNEVIDPASKDPDKIRDSAGSGNINRWYAIAGTDFIEEAYKEARKADPDAKLFYNDYGTEDPTKRDAIYKLVSKLKAENLIDGVGLQSHIDMSDPSIAQMEQTVKMFSDLGVDVQVTELDIKMNTTNPTSDDFLHQAYRYKAIFDMLKRYTHLGGGKGNVTGVTIWGIIDDESWLGSNTYPLLFDKNYHVKPAYWALVDPTKIPLNNNFADCTNGTPAINAAAYDNKWDLSKPYTINDSNGQSIGTFKTMWDNKNLYVYGKINDSTKSNNDSIELFVDQNNDKSTTIKCDNEVLYINRNDSTKTALTTSDGTVFNSVYDSSYGSVSETDGNNGYVFEGKIPLTSITPTAAGKIGFDIRVTNDGTVSSWNDPQNLQWSNPSRYGVLTLINPPRVSEALFGTPKMDVINLDPMWNNANTIDTTVMVSDNSTAKNTGKAKVKTLWDNNNLYVLADVYDPVLSDKSANTYEQDSVELFMDETNSKETTYNKDDSQLRINFKNAISTNPASASGKLSSVACVVYDENNPSQVKGYRIEAKISFNKPMLQGSAIGFDAQVNDDKDGDGSRDSVYSWNDGSGNSYKDTSGYGVLRLIEPMTVSDVTFSDLNDNPVQNLIGGKFVCGNAKVKNNMDSAQDVILVTTLTNPSGVMENISFVTKHLNSGEEESFGSGFNLPANVDGYKMKVFVWDSLLSMKALTNAIEISSK